MQLSRTNIFLQKEQKNKDSELKKKKSSTSQATPLFHWCPSPIHPCSTGAGLLPFFNFLYVCLFCDYYIARYSYQFWSWVLTYCWCKTTWNRIYTGILFVLCMLRFSWHSSPPPCSFSVAKIIQVFLELFELFLLIGHHRLAGPLLAIYRATKRWVSPPGVLHVRVTRYDGRTVDRNVRHSRCRLSLNVFIIQVTFSSHRTRIPLFFSCCYNPLST